MNVLTSVVVVISSVSLMVVGSATPAGMMRVDLKDTTGEPRPDRKIAPAISVFAELEPLQRDVRRGVEFALVFVNDSDDPVEFSDLMVKLDDTSENFVRIRLVNEEGVEVNLPDTPSIGKVNTRDPEGFRALWGPRRPLHRVPPDAHQRARGVKTPVDAVDGLVTLDPGEQYRVGYRVTHVVAEAKKYRQRLLDVTKGVPRPAPGEMDRPDMMPIRAGRYTLSMLVSVSDPIVENPWFRSFETEKGIDIQLGGQ